ncbi:testis-specific protein TEX28 [Eublepharis macularius]|uniref:Testis-specific protein TEX28 n=1 Tax=Eublepharis macularius TaxID=481883 RepID=A0AA97KN48_EUBMA|nr:testis-specific protein TEX28 [Eublepharis macularius]
MVDLYDPSKGELSQQAEDSISQHSSTEAFRDRSCSVASTATQGRRSSVTSTSSRNQRDGLYHRIFHLSELLRVEKANRDDNTSCYVELVSKADREKAPSIRHAFERINQRSCANIAHLEQRLQDCWNQLKKFEQRTAIAQESHSSAASSQQQFFTLKGSFSRPAYFGLSRIRSSKNSTQEEIHSPSPTDSEGKSPASEASTQQFLDELSQLKFEDLRGQLAELKGAHKALEDEWQKLEKSWKDDKWEMMELLQEEKKRHYSLEVQVNDVIQVNLSEITNLKHDLACTEEKMVYQSYERSRDIWEVLDSYQTRLAKLETQQQTQQMEALDLPQASVYKLYGQLMNLLLTIAAILLVCVSTISAFTLPLLRTPWRALATLSVITAVVLVWNYLRDIPELEWTTWLPST